MAFTARTEIFSIENFRSGFNVDEFFSRICRDALKELNEAKATEDKKLSNLSPRNKTKETLEKVRKLLESLKRSETRLRTLHETVTKQLQETQDKMENEKEVFKGVVDVLDSENNELRDAFKALDKKISNFGQTSARIGERLKRCHERQLKAADAFQQIAYLQDFSMVKGNGDFSLLPSLFLEKSKLKEAAMAAQRLLTLSSELKSTKRYTSLDGEDMPWVGTLEYALLKLEEYCNDLESKVVNNFDYAATKRDIETMSECADIMSELNREMTLAQRYICSRPMFLRVEELNFGNTGSPKDISSGLNELQSIYRNILATVRKEAELVQAVFPSPQKVMQIFLQRVMEQRIRLALDQLLVHPATQSTAEDIRDYIRLVADVYEKTHNLAINLERIINCDLELKDMADSLFSDYIGDYPEIELTWLSGLYEKDKQLNNSKKLDPDVVSKLSVWNKEAVARCKIISSRAKLPKHLKQLFHSSTIYNANTGCLLEQVARHVMEGLMNCWELCESNSNVTISMAALPDASKKTIYAASAKFISNGIGHLLEGISKTTQIIKQLKGYFESTIESLVSQSIAEFAECRSGLSAFGTAVEEKVLDYTNRALKILFSQIEKILATEQKKSEFRPTGGLAPGFDTPTEACQIVCGILSALIGWANENLEKRNLKAFLEEVGCVVSDILSTHITHFILSPAGALKLKRDMAEYVDTYRKVDAPEANAQFENLQQLANIFVVAPESLLGLVDGSLRMNHKEAMKYITLREDFKTAKIGGQSLAQIFTSDMQEF